MTSRWAVSYGQREEIEGVERKFIDSDGNEHNLVGVLNHRCGFSRFFEEDKPDQIGAWTGSTQWR